MAELSLVRVGDEGAGVLLRPAENLSGADLSRGRLKRLRRDLEYLMSKHNGIGFAAPQAGLGVRAFVWDDRRGHRGFVANPTLEAGPGLTVETEGCLSVPGVSCRVRRHLSVQLGGIGDRGELVNMFLSQLPAHIAQHEMDHLRGVLITERERELGTKGRREALTEAE